MPIGIIPMLRLPGLAHVRGDYPCFNAYRHYPYVETRDVQAHPDPAVVSMPIGIIPLMFLYTDVSMPIGIIPMLRRRLVQGPGAAHVRVSMPIGILPTLRLRRRYVRRPGRRAVSMPIGILPTLRRPARSWMRRHSSMFQCLSAFSLR